MPIDLEQSLENLKLERDAIQLYDALATIEKEPARAAAFRTIAGNERRHADVWATRLAGLGAPGPPPGRARGGGDGPARGPPGGPGGGRRGGVPRRRGGGRRGGRRRPCRRRGRGLR